MNDLSPLQFKLLRMLKAFHEFCVENSLTYYGLGGTLLGAIRHKGFIPWDDDIDVGMPREDYMRLCNILENNRINDEYELETIYSSKTHIYPYAKLYDTGTTLIETTRYNLKRGIYIDIFPLDGIGNSYREALRNYKPIEWRLRLLDLRKIKIIKERTLIKNAILLGAQLIPETVFSANTISSRIDFICQKNSYQNMKWGGNLVGAWLSKEIMPLSVFGKPCLHQFEDTMIFCPEKAEEYWTRQYGDWNSLPPKEKQISHHCYYLDLNKGYINN